MRRIAEFKKDNFKLLHNLMPGDEKVAFSEHDVVNVLTNRDQDGRRILTVNCGGKTLVSRLRDLRYKLLTLLYFYITSYRVFSIVCEHYVQ